MKVLLTQLEISMLLDAANRMEADDVWDTYTDEQSEALGTAAMKLGSYLTDRISKGIKKKSVIYANAFDAFYKGKWVE